MAYNKSERPDSPMREEADAEEKKFVYSAVKKTMKSATKM